jgi:aspartyl-tRNA(Asn)/glutamyl-tRNA(Gln) amidotransferase subunit A
MNLTELTIIQAHKGLINKDFSALDLTNAFLDKIKKQNKEIFAFLTITEEQALKQAKKVDEMISQGKEIPLLAGIPMAIKDNILIKGIKSTAGSKILEDYIAPYDATVIKKLKEQECVFLGKTNLDEFAMGSSCENSAFGITKNPRDLSRVPGGSSGGSGAAVAANMACVALGSETGGSIRLPACFCGAVGLKTTYGAVSRHGLMAMASSLDQIGPLTKTAEDCQIIFDAIKGKDEMDSTSVESNVKCQMSNVKCQNLKIGVPKEYFIDGMDKEVEKKVKQAIKKYEELGAKIIEISLPHTEYAVPVYTIIVSSEVSSNLARYDGIRYGYSTTKNKSGKIDNLLDVYLSSKADGFGPEVRRRIMLGTYSLSSGYYDAYYLRAQKVRALIKQDFEKAFEKVDVIMTPTSPTTAFKLGEKTTDPVQMYLADIFMCAINLAGLPAVSIPCGKIGNLPVGLQIIGNMFEENKILETAQNFEKYGN